MSSMKADHHISAGRYQITSKDRAVPGGRARINARLRSIQAVEAAVDDPYGDRQRILVTVNRRTDILEMERSHGRISEAAYRTGQTVQAVFQRLGYAGISAATFDRCGSADPVKAVGDRTVRMLESAQKVRAMMDGIARQLGMIDTRLLRRILGDRITFSQCAAFEGKTGERGERYVAARFRDALEELAVAWSSKARVPMRPDDKYSTRAAEVAEAQDVEQQPA